MQATPNIRLTSITNSFPLKLKNWIIEKEEREVSLVMENATERYIKLLQKHPNIDQRIQKLHIASHLGITPTQLSRIRKNIKKSS